jgi:hypothetical protein
MVTDNIRTRVDNPRRQEIFLDAYKAVHTQPETIDFSSPREDPTYFTYSSFMFWFGALDDGFADFHKTYIYLEPEHFYSDSLKCIWLLRNRHINNLHEKLISLILKFGDSLTLSDYALLLYSSSLNDKTFADVPLGMLHDIFDPIADDHIAVWLKN